MGELSGKRILVVEDEYFIASDLRRALEKEGAEVIGPVGDLGKGMALLDTAQVDAAVLDVNLEGTTSYSIADRLGREQVPYMFLTGYDDWAIPDAYRAVPRIAKPFPMNKVLGLLERIVAPEIGS